MNNTNNIAVTITGSGKITACIDGAIHTIDSTHPNYSKALQCVKEENWNGFLDAVDLTRKVRDFILNDNIQIVGGAISFKGEIVHNTLTKRIISFMQQDLPFKPLLRFLENLMENPSKRAVDELYDFLDVGELPITEDGHFLAFKNVKSDYKDIHSGTFNNSVGSVCEMRRNQVDEDKDRTCSYGLHFCSIAYLPHFRDSSGGKTMILKINPKDVVAIPADYNNTKGRTCRYEVIGEYTDDWRSKLDRGENGWDNDLYSSDGGEYENDDSDDYEQVCEDCGTILDNHDTLDPDHTICDPCQQHIWDQCPDKPDDEDKFDCTDYAEHQSQFVGNPDVVKTPSPTPYHNVRDSKGRFTPKQKSILNALKDYFTGNE